MLGTSALLVVQVKLGDQLTITYLLFEGGAFGKFWELCTEISVCNALLYVSQLKHLCGFAWMNVIFQSTGLRHFIHVTDAPWIYQINTFIFPQVFLTLRALYGLILSVAYLVCTVSIIKTTVFRFNQLKLALRIIDYKVANGKKWGKSKN